MERAVVNCNGLSLAYVLSPKGQEGVRAAILRGPFTRYKGLLLIGLSATGAEHLLIKE